VVFRKLSFFIGVSFCFLCESRKQDHVKQRCGQLMVELAASEPLEASEYNYAQFVFGGQKFLFPQEFIPQANLFSNLAKVDRSQKLKYLHSLEGLFSPIEAGPNPSREWVNSFNNLINMERPAANLDKAEEVTVFTHLPSAMQEAAAKTIHSRLNKIPVIALASDNYPVLSQNLLNQVARIDWSVSGEFIPPKNARIFHFLGGYCDACLSISIGNVVDAAAANPKARSTNIYIHASNSYVLTPGDGPPDFLIKEIAEQLQFNFFNSFSSMLMFGEGRWSPEKNKNTPYGAAYSYKFENPEGSGRWLNIYVVPE
jgi:hypothetical protein